MLQEWRNNRAICSGLVRILRLLRALQIEIFSQCWERGDECMLVPFLKSKKEVSRSRCLLGGIETLDYRILD